MKKCPTCQRQFPDDTRYCPRDKSALFQVRTVFEGAVIQQKYRVESKLGVGGMSTVYLIEHLIFHEKMAMKVMSSDCARDKNFRKRFEDEARIIRQLKSTFGRNIVLIEDVGETEDGLPFVVMEYIPGDSLDKLICPDGTPESRQPLEAAHALKIAVQICDALEIAHGHSVVHRDIKPENILLAQEDGVEVVKVLDFGIAKFDFTEVPEGERGTIQREYEGSPHYSSPEQAAGKTGKYIDGRSDLYSLGVVLYEMLTGYQPFIGESNKEILTKHIQTPPEPPDTLNPLLSESLVELTMKALEKAPSDRFQSAVEMRLALEDALKSMGDSSVRPTAPEYILRFDSEQGKMEYTVPIGHGETLSTVLDELIKELNDQGVKLKYYQPRGALRITSNDRELDQATPLRRQGIHSGDILLVCSVHVQQRDELEKWIRENETSEKLLELAPESLQNCRIQYADILQLEPAVGQQFSVLDRKCSDLTSVKGIMQKRGVVAGLAAVEKLLQVNPEFEAAGILRSRAIEELSGQLSSLIEKLQLEDASKLMSEIQSKTGSGESFAALEALLKTEAAALEARLREVTRLVAQGRLEQGRAILQSFRQKPQLRNGRSVTRLLSEFETTPVWVQGVSRVVAEERWQEARAALDERTSIFRMWLPFLSMLSALEGLELVCGRLKLGSDAEESRGQVSVLDEYGILDLRWAATIEFESAPPDSLCRLAHEILLKVGVLIGIAEKNQRDAEEDNLRQLFIAGLRELAKHDLQQACDRIDEAMAADPSPELESLRGELEYV